MVTRNPSQRQLADKWNRIASDLNVKNGRLLAELKAMTQRAERAEADADQLANRLREECRERDIYDDEALARHDAEGRPMSGAVREERSTAEIVADLRYRASTWDLSVWTPSMETNMLNVIREAVDRLIEQDIRIGTLLGDSTASEVTP